MKNVLVLVFSNLKHDARVTRQVQWLKKNYRVTVVCFDSEEIPGVSIVRVRQTPLSLPRKALLGAALLLRQYALAYRIFHSYESVVRPLNVHEYELVVANDIDTLPLAFRLKAKRVLFDAHEFAPRHFENNKVWKTFFQPFYLSLCRTYIPRSGAMLTVGQGLATEYEKYFGVKPVIITNATRYYEIRPSKTTEGKIRLIHHGIANESRRLELMIEMMDHLDERFTLDLILMTSDYASGKTKQYIRSLRERIEKHPRIQMLAPVKSHQIVETINHYDIGVFLIPPVNFNYANTLPNKLFDFIQARLGIAIGPTPEMAAIVNQYANGVVADDFEPSSLAAKLNNLRHEDVIRFKDHSSAAAWDLNAEKNEVTLNQTVEKLIAQRD